MKNCEWVLEVVGWAVECRSTDRNELMKPENNDHDDEVGVGTVSIGCCLWFIFHEFSANVYY